MSLLHYFLASVHSATAISVVILRSPARAGRRRILWFMGARYILHGVYPEPVEGLRMTMRSFRIDAN
jgi:hypothetical protein